MSEDKYKLFRNYMANELSITRDDIKQWTEDAVKEQAQKLVGQLGLNKIVERVAEQRIKEELGFLRQEVARNLAEKIKIEVAK